MDLYTVTINFKGFRHRVHENIAVVSVNKGLVGMSNNTGEKWVYPIDTIRDYHLKIKVIKIDQDALKTEVKDEETASN